MCYLMTIERMRFEANRRAHTGFGRRICFDEVRDSRFADELAALRLRRPLELAGGLRHAIRLADGWKRVRGVRPRLALNVPLSQLQRMMPDFVISSSSRSRSRSIFSTFSCSSRTWSCFSRRSAFPRRYPTQPNTEAKIDPIVMKTP